PALAQRPALVVTDVRDRREAALVYEHGDLLALQLDGEGHAREQLVAEPESVPRGHGRSGRSGGLEHTGPGTPRNPRSRLSGQRVARKPAGAPQLVVRGKRAAARPP